MNSDYVSLMNSLRNWELRFQFASNVNIHALAVEKFQFAMRYGYSELQRIYNEVVMAIYEESDSETLQNSKSTETEVKDGRHEDMPKMSHRNLQLRDSLWNLRLHQTRHPRREKTCYRRR